MQSLPANKMAKRERYPRVKDAFDRELKAIEAVGEADTLFARSPSEEAAAGRAKAEAALKAARSAYLEAVRADDRGAGLESYTVLNKGEGAGSVPLLSCLPAVRDR